MCKTKEYTAGINDLNESVAFRLDYFSVPSFKNDFVERLGAIIGKCDFQERLLTEEEKQKVAIDALSNTLDVSLEELIGKKIYKFYNFKIGDMSSELYISPYFLLLYIDKGRTIATSWNEISAIFSLLKSDFSLSLSPQNLLCITSYYASVDEGQLWTIFDRDAFPVLDDANIVNGRYADKHKYDSSDIDLIRELRKGIYVENESSNEGDIMYNVNIATYNNLEITSLDELDFVTKLPKMLHDSQKEVTRCFVAGF